MMLWLLVSGGLTAAMVVFLMMPNSPLAARLQRYADGPAVTVSNEQTWHSWKRFLFGSLARRVEKLLPGYYLQLIRTRLRMAGYYSPNAFQAFLAALVLTPIGLGLLGLLVGGRWALVFAAAFALVGLLVPPVMLNGRVKRYQEAINDVLSDTIDLMTASVEAGLGLDAAMTQLVSRNSKACWAINQEFNRYLQETQMGVPRDEALRNLGSRTGLEDLRTVVNALIQGDALGVGVSQILRVQSQHLRAKRKQRAEETAMKAPVKILFPLVLFIFPALFLVILGPAGLSIYDTLVLGGK